MDSLGRATLISYSNDEEWVQKLLETRATVREEEKNLSAILAGNIDPYAVDHVQQAIAKSIAKIEKVGQKIDKFSSIYPQQLVDEGLRGEIRATIQCGRQALHKLNYIFDADRFHSSCLKSRAMRLLQNKQEGTYLLRCEEDCFAINYNNPTMQEHYFEIKGNGTCFNALRAEVEFDDYLQKVVKIKAPVPLAHRPLDHLLAQMEYQVCRSSAVEMAKKVRLGGFFITSQELGSYQLHKVEKKNTVLSCPIQIQNGKLIYQLDNQRGEAVSFFDLYTTIFQTKCYRLSYTSPINDLAESICYCVVLPEMQRSAQRVALISRRDYKHLPASLLVYIDEEGKLQIHKKKHKKNFTTANGETILGEYNKGHLGKGSFKFAWALEPFYRGLQIPMARTRFHGMSVAKIEQLARDIAQLQSEVEDSTHLLFPLTFSYTRQSGSIAYGQMMPLMRCDLFHAIECGLIDFISALKAVRDAGLGLLAILKAGGGDLVNTFRWAHRDFKPENIFLGKVTKLGDFDLIYKLDRNDQEIKGSPMYMDPEYLTNNTNDPERVLLNEQYGFGATLFFASTRTTLRGDAQIIDDLYHLVDDDDLRIPAFKQLDGTLKFIIRNCCLGSKSDRSYHLGHFIGLLSQYITQLEQQ